MLDFVHLHVHTQYSILDGQASVAKLLAKATADGMRGMAVTDHGNMMGIKEFFDEANKMTAKAGKQVAELEEKLAAVSAEEERESICRQLEKARRTAAFKPIFGCEMYCARRGMLAKETKEDQSGWHLIVLAKNKTGYHNLIKLVSNSWVDGFYMRPRTDHEQLERYKEGLIICSACLGGELPQKIMKGDIAGAEASAKWFRDIWGEDYYIELQRHEVKDPQQRANRETYPLQVKTNAELINIAHKLGIKLICSNDTHFVDEENAEAHDRLICLSTGRDLDDPTRMLYTKQEWFKTRGEMNEIFADIPEALENTCEICDKVETYNINHGPIMPNFDIPEDFGTEEEYRKRINEKELFNEFTCDENGNVVMEEAEARKKIEKLGGYDKLYRIKLEADYLAKLTYDGAKKKYGDPLDDVTAERLKFELHVMKTMGFPGYFLIVQDYIRAAREELGVSVGPGRGSAAGSAVAYCLGITLVDPIKYDLLFERFLNPDRISLPDIDVDFDDDGRGSVLQWVTQKYGEANVAHIITYGTMATKMALKDVARVQKLPLNISNQLCKLIPDKLPEGPDGKTPKMNLTNAIAAIPELRDAEASNDPLMRDTIRYAKMLEGNVRGTGVHACGFIICKDRIDDWVPVSTAYDKETKEQLHCTQYEGRVIEDTGLIKMDFLGLKTLSIIKEAVENIKQSLGIVVNIEEIDIEDKPTYQLYCDGRTIGTFQFESAGMQKYLRELQPSTFEDLIAMNALYRPGPMQYIPDFIARKHGDMPITYDLPCMERYLKDTYGITVYQEQVMLLSREIANFTRGESDTLRKAMGKKMKDKLDHMKEQFVSQGIENGHKPQVLNKIWTDWEAFASYAFNKSHATCYSWVAYQTAYLKANYPSQYMAAVMSRAKDNITEVSKLMDECKSMGINTLGPDVNESRLKFAAAHDGTIRYGLGAIKGMGGQAALAILEERDRNGVFKDIYNFAERIDLRACNRKAFELLAISGALDCFGFSREQYLTLNERGEVFLDSLIRYGLRHQEERQSNIISLFGDSTAIEITKPQPEKEYIKWSALERLNKERALTTLYFSGHPLDDYFVILEHICNLRMENIEDREDFRDKEVTLGGIVTAVRRGVSKKGSNYGIVTMEDFSGAGEIALFGKQWADWCGYMQEGNSLFISGRMESGRYDQQRIDLNINKVEFLNEIKESKVENINIKIDLKEFNDLKCSELSQTLQQSPGNTDVFFTFEDETGSEVRLHSTNLKVNVTKSLIDNLTGTLRLSYEINSH
ncbi:MAG: DNA polymerase III subunit alpha [Prevotellaceae bacterium]|nr:DNA polymerase III subunit alpha [Prevotellaceae bacterium]